MATYIIRSAYTCQKTGKVYYSYFAARVFGGMVNEMTISANDAKEYPTRFSANQDRKRYFGSSKKVSVISKRSAA